MYGLKSIVKEWIAENGKSESQMARLYTIALSGLRELNMDVNGIVKIVELCINDNDTVDLPDDFLNYSKIGIVGGDGRIHCLGRDNSINLNPTYNNCGIQVKTPDTNNTDFPFYGLPYAGYFYGVPDGSGAIFGLGGGNNNIGYYRLNRSTRQLWLANMNVLAGTTLIMEYISDVNVSSNGEDFEVNPFAIEAIKMFISWRYVMGDRNTSIGEKQLRERLYYNARRISNARYGASTVDEWAAALRVQNVATPRF